MSKYGYAAVRAVELVQMNVVESPTQAWEMATSEIFGEGSWGQKKGCPKNAFLGLCEEGLIETIPQGAYNTRKSSKNKVYAVKAVNCVRKQPNLLEDLKMLWMQATNSSGISHNYQMDVVKALIGNNYMKI